MNPIENLGDIVDRNVSTVNILARGKVTESTRGDTRSRPQLRLKSSKVTLLILETPGNLSGKFNLLYQFWLPRLSPRAF